MEPDPWWQLRNRTAARIALGRAGGSLPTAEVTAFARDHAAARDAVHAELDVAALQTALAPVNLPIQVVHSAAADRATYLQRPDLGRALADDAALEGHGEISLILGDGLSALATQTHGPTLLTELIALLKGRTIAPIIIARQARVALADPIGEKFGATVAVMILGERPGLGSADSLGAYLVYAPKTGRSDAERNCVSNIRPAGLPPKEAAQLLHYLIEQSIAKRISGVMLKDDRVLVDHQSSKIIS